MCNGASRLCPQRNPRAAHEGYRHFPSNSTRSRQAACSGNTARTGRSHEFRLLPGLSWWRLVVRRRERTIVRVHHIVIEQKTACPPKTACNHCSADRSSANRACVTMDLALHCVGCSADNFRMSLGRVHSGWTALSLSVFQFLDLAARKNSERFVMAA